MDFFYDIFFYIVQSLKGESHFAEIYIVVQNATWTLK